MSLPGPVPVRVLVVDRDAAARRRVSVQLRALARSVPMQIVAHAASQQVDAAAILAEKPDVVVLDAMPPDFIGLPLARALRAQPEAPQVILIVPSDDLATEAQAIDLAACLRRPLHNDDLAAALDQAVAAMEDQGRRSRPEHGIKVVDRGLSHLLAMDDILYLRAEAKYVVVRTRDREFLSEQSLSALYDAHAPRLLRVHRNTLVVRKAIRAARRVAPGVAGPDAEGHWELALHGVDEAVPVSRRQWSVVRNALPGLPIEGV